MRKLIFGINLTADGCCDHTKGIADEEVHEYFAQLMREAGVLLYGRITYGLMVPFWPDIAKAKSGGTKAMNDFAAAFDAVERIVVFSKSLDEEQGEKTTVLRTGLADEVRRLKQEDGGNILTGGVDIPSQLIALGLVDEFHFVIHPVIAGAGRRFMDMTGLPSGIRLRLVGSKVFKSGCVAMRYVAG